MFTGAMANELIADHRRDLLADARAARLVREVRRRRRNHRATVRRAAILRSCVRPAIHLPLD
jgi:hypothetical protein